MEKGTLGEIAKDGQLAAYKHHGFWKSMDAMRDRLELESMELRQLNGKFGNKMNYSHLEKHFKGKKSFLTGHTGFKGSWMLYWLVCLVQM